MELDDFNLAEKILSALDEHKPLLGYPSQIDKDRLWNMRQHLRFLLETTWDEVGLLGFKLSERWRICELL